VPLVARRPELSKEEARRRLDLGTRPVVLLSFGGPGLPGIDLGAYGGLNGYRFLLTGSSGDGGAPSNLRRLDGGELEAAGLEYPDLVGAADVVVTKPGYGIVTDCIGAGTRMVYTDRGDFPEYPILSREMKRYIPAVHATNDDVRRGRLGPALESVAAMPMPERPRIDGADVAADRLLAELA
jgi:L-arabinokinase